MLLGLAIGAVALFIAVIVLGLRFAARRQTVILRDTKAADLLAQAGLSDAGRAALLYGIWQMTMSEVILHERDGSDTEVALVVHRVAGAVITLGQEQYTVVVASGRNESAACCVAAIARGIDSAVRLRTSRLGESDRFTPCRHKRTQPPRALEPVLGPRTEGDPAEQPARWPIVCPGWHDLRGRRALILPPSMALPIRVFILYKAFGLNASNS